MRNSIFIILMLVSICSTAQSNIYEQLKQTLQKTHPEIQLAEKLLAFNVWSVEDASTRDANKEFDRAYKVYEYAKLKGGLRGIIVFAINKDNWSTMATVAYNKDGIIKVIPLALENFVASGLDGISNVTFDSSGEIVYKNLPAGAIFNSVNQLITR